ncbi:MAG: hypothetical protein U9N41_06135 [Euryarchaeota archaeon]|nr:hypothetical protein [Euryarchaeota archaeon]
MELKEIKNKNGDIFPIISKGKSLFTISKLKESVEAKTFIEMALEDQDVLSLLCTHYSILSVFEKSNFPMLFSITRGAKVKPEFPFALVATRETTKAKHTIERIVERAKPTFENLVEKYTGKYGKLLEDTGVKGDVVGFQEERDKQILSIIISRVIIQEVSDEEKILRIIKMFEDSVIDDIVPVGLAFVDSLKKEFIDFGMKTREKMIFASELDEGAYEDTINKLGTRYKVIKPLLSIFWCENENHEHYSFFMFSHSTVPTIKCPICNKSLSVGTFYYFIPSINHLLRGREGLIHALTMYLIDKTGREWLPGVYLKNVDGDTEKDIVFKKDDNRYCLIEIKSFATDVSPRIKKGHIEQLMDQTLKHLNSYLKQNIVVSDIYLVSNYWVDGEIEHVVSDLLQQKKFAKLRENNLEIVGTNNVRKFNELKHKQDE